MQFHTLPRWPAILVFWLLSLPLFAMPLALVMGVQLGEVDPFRAKVVTLIMWTHACVNLLVGYGIWKHKKWALPFGVVVPLAWVILMCFALYFGDRQMGNILARAICMLLNLAFAGYLVKLWQKVPHSA